MPKQIIGLIKSKIYEREKTMIEKKIKKMIEYLEDHREEVKDEGISFAIMMADKNGGRVVSGGDSDELLEMYGRVLNYFYQEVYEKDLHIAEFVRMICVAVMGEDLLKSLEEDWRADEE